MVNAEVTQKLSDAQINGLLEDLPDNLQVAFTFMDKSPLELVELAVAVYFEKRSRETDDNNHHINDLKQAIAQEA
ncbi:MAG: hypothetical protein LBC12_05875 [Nitrososphaerota archaeon]|nr:hypothetical protein [Nitrososphaerota archaeon]